MNLLQKKLIIGSKVYEVNSNNNIVEWIVTQAHEVSRWSTNYTLRTEDGNSFCTYNNSEIGRCVFIDEESAMKEREKRAF